MVSRWSYFWWFTVPFVLTLVIITSLRLGVSGRSKSEQVDDLLQAPAATALVGHTLSAEDLLEAQSRTPATTQGLSLPDTAVVILLGGIGCSDNQVKLLRYWSEQHAAAGLQHHPVLVIYIDPVLGVKQRAYETLLLRRVSQAPFPFLVSQDSDFNLRAMGIRTPQVVLVESGVITQVFNSSLGQEAYPEPAQADP